MTLYSIFSWRISNIYWNICNLFPDSKQSFGQRWVMVGVVGNTSLLACWHWPNTEPTLTFQKFKYCCWPNVGFSTTHQRWILSCGANVGPKTCLPTIVVIFLLKIKYLKLLFSHYGCFVKIWLHIKP